MYLYIYTESTATSDEGNNNNRSGAFQYCSVGVVVSQTSTRRPNETTGATTKPQENQQTNRCVEYRVFVINSYSRCSSQSRVEDRERWN